MLVLWGHGTRAFPVVDVRQTAPDPEALGPDVMTAERVGKQIGEEVSDSPAAPDIIGYDACRMASRRDRRPLARDVPGGGSSSARWSPSRPAAGPTSSCSTSCGRDWTTPKPWPPPSCEAYAASVDVPATGAWSPWTSARCTTVLAAGPAASWSTSAHRPRRWTSSPPRRVRTSCDDTDLVDLGALMRRLDRRGPTEPNEFATDGAQGAASRRRWHDAPSGNLAGRDGLSVRVGCPRGARTASTSGSPIRAGTRCLPDLPVEKASPSRRRVATKAAAPPD